jgi:excisionase family DNA binding protein
MSQQLQQLTVTQAAQLAGVSAGTVRGWIRRGMLRADRVTTPGHAARWVIDFNDLAVVPGVPSDAPLRVILAGQQPRLLAHRQAHLNYIAQQLEELFAHREDPEEES